MSGEKLCACGHPRSEHTVLATRWGRCSTCSCGRFRLDFQVALNPEQVRQAASRFPTLRLDPNDPAVAEAERRARLPQEPAGVQWLMLVEMLEHQREVQALALAEQEARTRKAKVELATAERINKLVVEHDRLVDLPDLGGKPS